MEEENTESKTMELQKCPRNLLDMFNSTPDSTETKPTTKEEERQEINELNLGLSLGGCFGVDKSLARSSSVVCTLPIVQENSNGNDEKNRSRNCNSLIRATPLPTETEEDWRKREEMQSLKTHGAKRCRPGNQESGEFGSCGEEKKDGDMSGSTPLPPWVVANRSVFLGCKVKIGSGVWRRVVPQGGSSAGVVSAHECKPIGQGSGSCGETRNPAVNQSNQDRNDQNVTVPLGTRPNQGLVIRSVTPNSAVNRGMEIGLRALARMPGVFTRGSGPNGKRIDGVLYMYRKEPRIMCICHGGFHTPKEFVRHAGGDDVDQPLKHIVVCASSPSTLSQ